MFRTCSVRVLGMCVIDYCNGFVYVLIFVYSLLLFTQASIPTGAAQLNAVLISTASSRMKQDSSQWTAVSCWEVFSAKVLVSRMKQCDPSVHSSRLG